VTKFSVADRFETIDGDFHTVDFRSANYDYAMYGNIAHQETPANNVAIFRKFRKALKPGGTLLINDFVLNDDRTGHPFAMMFASQMLLATGLSNLARRGRVRVGRHRPDAVASHRHLRELRFSDEARKPLKSVRWGFLTRRLSPEETSPAHPT